MRMGAGAMIHWQQVFATVHFKTSRSVCHYCWYQYFVARCLPCLVFLQVHSATARHNANPSFC